MKRNTSFAQNLISNFEANPQLQKIELKRQKKNLTISQAINYYNLKKARQHSSINSNNNTIVNILNNSNYNTYNSNIPNISTRTKPSIKSIKNEIKYKTKGPDTQVISTGENIPLNLFEIYSNENDKALLFKFTKYNNESNIDYILLKLGTIRLNLFSQYISTCLNVLSDYKTILNQPIIKSIQKFENGIMIEKQLFNMKKYMLNFIKKLPDKKTNDPHIKEYIKFLEKEIEIGKKLGIDSDCYEINYLFNFFPKGIEIMCDYNTLECVYYNSKKNNKISGKALLPSPEFCFKLDPDKFGIKFFDFEFEIEDLDDIKNIMTQIWKIIQDKIQVAKLFIEPCLVQARMDLENKQKDNNKDKEIKRPISNKNIIDIDNKFTSIDNIKNKNIINSINDKTNTTEMTLSNNINDTNTINRANITVSKKNLTYTTANYNNNNENIIKNIETHLNFNKGKFKNLNKEHNIENENREEIIPIKQKYNQNKEKKLKNQNLVESDEKNDINDFDDEKSQETEKKIEFFKEEENSASMDEVN